MDFRDLRKMIRWFWRNELLLCVVMEMGRWMRGETTKMLLVSRGRLVMKVGTRGMRGLLLLLLVGVVVMVMM